MKMYDAGFLAARLEFLKVIKRYESEVVSIAHAHLCGKIREEIEQLKPHLDASPEEVYPMVVREYD